MATAPPSPQQRLRRPELADLAAAVVLLIGDLALPSLLLDDPRTPLEAALTVLTLALLPLRYRLPVPALVLTTVGASGVVMLRGLESVAPLAPLLALYLVALRSDRRSAVLAWGFTVALLAPASALGAPRSEVWEDALSILPWTAVVAAAGNGVGHRRAYLAAVEERAARAERSSEQEALRRVAEERVRIARELHDVVAHHIAVVSVQAGAAQHLLAADPAAAADALGHVRRSASTVLEELGDILTVLRQPGEGDTSRAPAPGLERLDALVGSFNAAGLVVDWTLRGQSRDLPATVDLVAYRITEEALTNALKHGTGTAHLDVEHSPTSLRVRVTSPVAAPVMASARSGTAAPHSPGTGHGLLGMRERAAAVGGTLEAGPGAGGTFRVQALLPHRGRVS